MREIEVLAYRVNSDGYPCKSYLTKVNDDYRDLQEFVGGYFEIISLGENFHIICAEEALDKNPNRAFLHNGNFLDIIRGNFFVCRRNGAEMEDIKQSDIEGLEKIFRPVTEINGQIRILSEEQLAKYE